MDGNKLFILCPSVFLLSQSFPVKTSPLQRGDLLSHFISSITREEDQTHACLLIITADVSALAAESEAIKEALKECMATF